MMYPACLNQFVSAFLNTCAACRWVDEDEEEEKGDFDLSGIQNMQVCSQIFTSCELSSIFNFLHIPSWRI